MACIYIFIWACMYHVASRKIHVIFRKPEAPIPCFDTSHVMGHSDVRLMMLDSLRLQRSIFCPLHAAACSATRPSGREWKPRAGRFHDATINHSSNGSMILHAAAETGHSLSQSLQGVKRHNMHGSCYK